MLRGSKTVDVSVGGVVEDSTENVIGGSAGDTLTGDGFANLPRGGAGDGNDQFVFTANLIAANADSITNFEISVDHFQLDRSVFTALAVGMLDSDALWIGPSPHDADDRIIYNSATGELFYDSNGSAVGESVQFAPLDPGWR